MIKIQKLAFACSLLFSVSILADSYNLNERPSDPSYLSDSSWATFSGSITDTEQNFFTLDYGNGEITVSLNELDNNKAYSFKEGHTVTVTGQIDKTFFDNAILNASTVYIDVLNTTLFSNSMDANDRIAFTNSRYAELQDDVVTLIGWVEQTDELMDSITLDIGEQTVEVNLDSLSFDPFAEGGLIQLDKGDRVKVTTSIDEAVLSDYRFEAKSLIVL